MFGRLSAHSESRELTAVRGLGLSRTAFAVSAFLLEVTAIVAVAVATGVGYHVTYYGVAGDVEQYAAVGGLAALGYGLTFLLQDEYGVESLLEGRRSNGRLFFVWNLTFGALAIIGFLTKTTAIFSRAWLVIFYLAGLAIAIALNAGLHRTIGTLIERHVIRPRRLMLVGTQDEIKLLEREIADGAAGAHVSAKLVVDGDDFSRADTGEVLSGAIENARALGIEDVIIAGTWYRGDFIEHAVAAFSLLPVVIHLGAGGLVSRFKHARVSRFGRATTLSLTREPLGPFQRASKRAFDLAVASLALILLAPLLALVACLIKLDSKGPVFFRQRRRGYNLVEFRMWKFRTMTTLEDGENVQQATEGDARVTRVGRILRKTSIDELPQLINVLAGHMSIVGPRPHAVAHDRFFEKRIEKYPRRLNVKPGITGWAQVNGLRGATETDNCMRQRLDHDLYYIDNWSLLFDVYIVLLTAFSRKSMRNAY